MKINEIINVTKEEINNIPCMVVKRRDANGKLPTVFLYHGWCSCKENQTFFAQVLATNGYQVIVPDAHYHGERGRLDYGSTEVLQEHFWKVIIKSTEESKDLIEEAIKSFDIDSDRIAVIGNSMGGFSSTGIFANNSIIKTMICVSGSGSWEKSEELFRSRDGRTPDSENEVSELRRFNPVRHIKDINLRPMLLLHGQSDSIIPIECQNYFYEEIAEAYSCFQDRIKYVKVPRMDHYISLGMLEEMVDWLNMTLA